MLLCLMIVLSTSQVWAARVCKPINLNQNKEVTQKADKKKKKKYYSYYYKLSVPGDGFITLSLQKGKKTGNRLSYGLYKKPGDIRPIYSNSIAVKGKADIQIPMGKGIIYLRTTIGSKVKWKFTKVTPPSNYAPDTAMSLKKGKKVTISQTPQNSYDRWFKVTLTKKQRITFWAEAENLVDVYNEDMEKCDVERAGSQSLKYYTSDSLKAGTYYLCMREKDFADMNEISDYKYRFYYSSFYWK